MLKLLDQRKKNSFRERLGEYDIPADAFKVLTFFFRQAVMQSKWAGYSYQHETQVEIQRNLSNENRLKLAVAYIRDWEQRIRRESGVVVDYGFEAIEVSEMTSHLKLASELEILFCELESLKSKAPTLMGEDVIDDMKEIATSKFIASLKKDKRQLNHYLHRSNGKLEIREEHFHYFTRHIGLSYGTFREYFYLRQGADSTNSSPEAETMFYRFLSDRMRHEHQTLPKIASYFSYRRIRDRVRNSAVGERHSGIPLRSGILTSDFLKYLSDLDRIVQLAS